MSQSPRQPEMKAGYKANSVTLRGAVAMGTGVMIGAGIFALTGQIAELAGPLGVPVPLPQRVPLRNMCDFKMLRDA